MPKFTTYKTTLLLAFFILSGFTLRLFWYYWGLNASQFSDIDELEAYIFGQELTYYNHARFFTYLPGPWQSLIAFFTHDLFNSVRGMYLFWVGVGTIQIGLIYLFAFIWTKHQGTALIASFITAFFPWHIQYTSSFWNPYFIIPLITLSLICLKITLDNKKSFFIIPFLLLYATMPFFHMFSAFTVPYVSYLLIKKKKEIHLSAFIIGLSLSALLYVPFIVIEEQNNWHILSGYFNNTNTLFKVESLKVLTNLIVVMSHEVSRFISADFKEYQIYLNRFFGHYIIAFLLIIPSFYFGLLAWVHFFKKKKSDSLAYQSIFHWQPFFWKFILSTSLFFFLATRTNHELRYTVVFWPMLTVILASYLQKEIFNVFATSFFKSSKKIKLKKIILFVYFLMGVYLSITLPIYLGQPGINNTGAHFYPIPSLIYWEKTEDLLRKNTGTWNKKRGAKTRPHQQPEYSIHSWFKETKRTSSHKLPSPTLWIDTSYYEKEIGKNNIRKQKYLLKKYLNYNQWITLLDRTDSKSPTTTDYTVMFLPLHQQPIFKSNSTLNFRFWGNLPNGSVWGRKN